MSISRRALIQSAGLAALASGRPNPAHVQQNILKVVWMGWPDHQVLPLFAEIEERNPTIKLAVERMPFQQIFQALEIRLNARNSIPVLRQGQTGVANRGMAFRREPAHSAESHGFKFRHRNALRRHQYPMVQVAVTRPATPGFREYENILRVARREIQSGANVQQTLSAAAVKIDREIVKYEGRSARADLRA